VLQHRFRFQNPTGKVLRVLEKVCSCACTASELDKTTLAPGETATLIMKVHPQDALRSWSLTCTLKTDLPELPVFGSELTFRTYPRVRFTGQGVRLDPNDDAGAEAWVDTYSPAEDPPDPLISVDVPEPLIAQVDPAPTEQLLEGGRVRRLRYRVHLGLKPSSDAPGGGIARTINARTSRGRAAASTVTWTSRSPLVVAPQRVHFSVARDAPSPPVASVTVRSTDERVFRVLGIDGGPCIEAGLVSSTEPDPRGASRAYRIDLHLRADQTTDRFAAGQITINTDHPEAPRIRIEWTAVLPIGTSI
jgi:hypothetical protein